jgi:hypothetical protein
MSLFKKISLFLLLFYTFVGFVLIPYILKSQLPQLIQNNTKATASVASVSFNPFAFTFSLEGFALYGVDHQPLFKFQKFYFNFDPYALVMGEIKIKEVLLQKPHLFLTRYKDKRLNINEIIKENQQKQEQNSSKSMQLPHIFLNHCVIEDGQVDYLDQTHQDDFTFSMQHLGFVLKNIDTHSMQNKPGKARFYTTLGDGGFIDIQSQLTSLDPFVAQGGIDFEASKLYTHWRYVKDMLQLEVADGKISYIHIMLSTRNSCNSYTL